MAKQPILARDARVALISAFALITLAELIEDGALGLAVGVIAFGLIAYAMTRIPVRHSIMGLMFFAMILPNPSEGLPTPWRPPYTNTGQALLTHLNTIDRTGPLGSVPVSAMELYFGVLFLIIHHRKRFGSKIDGELPPTPKPLIRLAQISLAATGFTWALGLATGGDFAFSLWQVNAVLYLPVIFLLMQASFRGPGDHWAFAKIYLIAASYKCALATFVVNTFVLPGKEEWESRPAYGTSHADSMLFAMGFAILAAPFLESADRNWKKLTAAVLPVLVIGTISNNRRLAWVQIGIVLTTVFVLSRETAFKKFVRRASVALIPVFIVYASAGWESRYGGFFKPVRILRSVVDTEADQTGSSQWREYENINILATFRNHPLFGTGYGHPYEEVVIMPPVDYSLERYIPHNSLLGLWGYAGTIGFAGLTMLWVAGAYFAVRAYRGCADPVDRSAAIVCLAALPIYLVQSWGDLGLNAWTGIYMMAASIAISGKLAVSAGQWPVSTRKREG